MHVRIQLLDGQTRISRRNQPVTAAATSGPQSAKPSSQTMPPAARRPPTTTKIRLPNPPQRGRTLFNRSTLTEPTKTHTHEKNERKKHTHTRTRQPGPGPGCHHPPPPTSPYIPNSTERESRPAHVDKFMRAVFVRAVCGTAALPGRLTTLLTTGGALRQHGGVSGGESRSARAQRARVL